MFNLNDIARFYDNVLKNEVEDNCVSKIDIRNAVQNMKDVYKYKKTKFAQEVPSVADYDDAVYRCAYLHKFAALHTSMVQEMFSRALFESKEVHAAVNKKLRSEKLKICSLGGGPGIDVIGVLAAVHGLFGFQSFSAQIVELMQGWELTCDSVLGELEHGNYGPLSQNVSSRYLDCSYVFANLLGPMDKTVSEAITSSDLITMVKFISAALCQDTEAMVEKIFNLMKPGALVFFIDSTANVFKELLSRTAANCNLISVFKINRIHYSNRIFDIKRYGCKSCFGTSVTVQVLMKYQNLRMQRISQDPNMVFPRLRNPLENASIRNNIYIPSSGFIALPISPAVSQLANFNYPRPRTSYSSTENLIQRDNFVSKQHLDTTSNSLTTRTSKSKIIDEPNSIQNTNGNSSDKSNCASNHDCGDYYEKDFVKGNLMADSSLLVSEGLTSIREEFTKVLTDITNRIECTFRTIIPIFNDSILKKDCF